MKKNIGMRIGAPFNVNQCEITKLLPITNYQKPQPVQSNENPSEGWHCFHPPSH